VTRGPAGAYTRSGPGERPGHFLELLASEATNSRLTIVQDWASRPVSCSMIQYWNIADLFQQSKEGDGYRLPALFALGLGSPHVKTLARFTARDAPIVAYTGQSCHLALALQRPDNRCCRMESQTRTNWFSRFRGGYSAPLQLTVAGVNPTRPRAMLFAALVTALPPHRRKRRISLFSELRRGPSNYAGFERAPCDLCGNSRHFGTDYAG